MPPAAPQERPNLEPRPRRGLPGNLVVRDAELLGDGTAITAVPVEQLHNAGRLAELTRPPQRALVGYRIDQPDAPVHREGVRGPLHEVGLGRDPAKREADLIDKANAAHAGDGTWPDPLSTAYRVGLLRGRATRSSIRTSRGERGTMIGAVEPLRSLDGRSRRLPADR